MDNNNTKTVVKHFDKVIYASIINEQSVKNKKDNQQTKKRRQLHFLPPEVFEKDWSAHPLANETSAPPRMPSKGRFF